MIELCFREINHSKMKKFRMFLSICNCLVLFPYSIQGNTSFTFVFRPVAYIARLVLLLSLAIYCQFVVCYRKMLESKSLNEVVFVCCTFLIVASQFQLNVQSIVHRKEFKAIITTLQTISLDISKRFKLKSKLEQIVSLEITYLLVLHGLLNVMYFVNYNVSEYLLYTIGYTIPKLSIVISSFLFINFLILIQDRFDIIEKSLHMRNIRQNQHLLKNYFKLVSLVNRINDLFGYQNLFSITHYICWVFYEVYHWVLLISQHNISPTQSFLILYATTWTTVQFSTVVLTVFSCHQTQMKAKRIVTSWYALHVPIGHQQTASITYILKTF